MHLSHVSVGCECVELVSGLRTDRPPGEQIRQDVFDPWEMHCSDDTLGLCCYITQLSPAALHERVLAVPTVHNMHCCFLVTVHLDFGSPQPMARYSNCHDRSQHLKGWYMTGRHGDSDRELRLEEFLLTHSPTANQTRISHKYCIRLASHSIRYQGYSIKFRQEFLEASYISPCLLTHWFDPMLTGLTQQIQKPGHKHLPLSDTFAHKMQHSKQHLQLLSFTVSNRMPRKTILVAGEHALAPDSANPSFFSSYPRNSKDPCALLSTSAPPRSSR